MTAKDLFDCENLKTMILENYKAKAKKKKKKLVCQLYIMQPFQKTISFLQINCQPTEENQGNISEANSKALCPAEGAFGCSICT